MKLLLHQTLSIFELKEYLGHKHLSSTQHYLLVDPTKLASKVAKAGYLEQNLATVEVLLDQEAVLSGAAARGEVWKISVPDPRRPLWHLTSHIKDILTTKPLLGRQTMILSM